MKRDDDSLMRRGEMVGIDQQSAAADYLSAPAMDMEESSRRL